VNGDKKKSVEVRVGIAGVSVAQSGSDPPLHPLFFAELPELIQGEENSVEPAAQLHGPARRKMKSPTFLPIRHGVITGRKISKRKSSGSVGGVLENLDFFRKPSVLLEPRATGLSVSRRERARRQCERINRRRKARG